MILVLGGTGFIGKNICNVLAEANYDVVSFDRDSTIFDFPVQGLVGDFFNDEMLFSWVDKADCIIHAISTISTNNCKDQYMRGYERDFLQSVKLFDYAARQGKKVIFLSSGGTVYGNPKTIPTPETEPTHPISHYGAIKLCIETVAQVINREMGNYIYSMRIANPYGPGQDFKKGIGFIDAVLRKAICGEKLSIWGEGNIIRDYIYIKDVAEVAKFLVEYNGPNTAFNVGSGVGTSQNQIIEYAKEMGLSLEVEYLEARSVDVAANTLDNSLLRSVYPQTLVTLKEGMKEYYQYLLNAKETGEF